MSIFSCDEMHEFCEHTSPPVGHIYDFTFYTPVMGGIKTSRFAIDTSDAMGDTCRVLFVDDIDSRSTPVMFGVPRERLMEMLSLMVAND